MNRNTLFLNGLTDLRAINRQAGLILDHAEYETLGTMGDLGERRRLMKSFRSALGEMKFLCLQMEIVLAEDPTTWRAANDAGGFHEGDGLFGKGKMPPLR